MQFVGPKFFFIISLLSIRNVLGEIKESKLIFAQIIYRHGDRSPTESYPNDPWKDESHWPDGFGQLTNLGKQQNYELGQFLRQRYETLLGDGSYSRNKIYVQSTDVDRTLMTAQGSLAGMFPPAGDKVWNDNFLWQPIPIHTVPENSDHIVACKRPCERYDYELKRFRSTQEQQLWEKYKPLIEYLTLHSGKNFENLGEVADLYDVLFIQNLKNQTLPIWTKKVFSSEGDWAHIWKTTLNIRSDTPELARVTFGFLLREIIERFNNKSQSILSPDRSMWIYSGHDTTIGNILKILGLYDDDLPPYASCLMFELHELNGDFYIQIFYRKTKGQILEPLNIPKCGGKCPLKKFHWLYRNNLPIGSFEEECSLTNYNLKLNSPKRK